MKNKTKKIISHNSLYFFERKARRVSSRNLARTALHPHLISQDYKVIKCMDWSLVEI
jgi:hypothetical protein